MRMQVQSLNWRRVHQKQKVVLKLTNNKWKKRRKRRLNQLPHSSAQTLQWWLLQESRAIRRAKPDPQKR